ncbi:thioesterase superfamily protein [Trypanosoma theileri]|uniref:Thioesterase superfamily protein n=1 Tax=Trypanosoma theileri TaxID=67003 RepID=A0A1X0NZ15_9TRYP|nr:thioesterase superfamily protein [Trypanosoma theileri]ORC89390.1 thioesterase superfamily protein [Trypanosoma theileri]
MLKRFPFWVPVSAHTPSFLERGTQFTQSSPHTQLLLTKLNYRLEETRVLCIPDTRKKERLVSLAMAFPFTITADACDVPVGMKPEDTPVMSCGALTSLVDTTTSLHVVERLLPENITHVSVDIQVRSLHPIRAGDRVVLISRMDKMGARLAFLSAELLHDNNSEIGLDTATTETTSGKEGEDMNKNGNQVGSLKVLEEMIVRHRVLAQGNHVKCLLR